MSETGKVYQIQYPTTVSGKVYNVRDVTGEQNVTGKVYQVSSINGGGGGGATIKNQDKQITKNGTYTADAGYTGLGTVSVNVPNPSTGTVTITENGSYDVTEYATAEVNVPTGGGGVEIKNQDITVTVNGSYTADEGYTGLGTVNVNVPTGGASTTKYGMTIDDIFGDVSNTDGLVNSTRYFTADFTGVTKIGYNGLAYKFASYGTNKCSYVEKILMPDVVAVDGSGCYSMAEDAYQLKEVDLSGLAEISITTAFANAFYGCGQLTVAKMDNLTTISGTSSCAYMFFGASSLSQFPLENLVSISGSQSCDGMFTLATFETVMFRNLVSITGTDPVRSMFTNAKIKRAYFPMLTELGTNVFRSSRQIFASCTTLEEIHFRADMQAAVEAQPGYASKLGASNATIYFDL